MGAFHDLAGVSLVAVMPDQAVLGDAVSFFSPVGSNVGMSFNIGSHGGLVYQFAILRNTAGVFCIVLPDRQDIPSLMCVCIEQASSNTCILPL